MCNRFDPKQREAPAPRSSGRVSGSLSAASATDVSRRPVVWSNRRKDVAIVDITCDVQQIDETGYVWAFFDEAADPSVIRAGAIVMTGDDEEPVFARVIDIFGNDADRKVHLDLLPATP
jgi:hypothetical protein